MVAQATQERQQLAAAIAALENQRALLGDAVVDAALGPMRDRLAALLATSVPAQSLRQVSILFLDVVGSTTLSQRLDPEAISAVMDDALRRGTAVVDAHGGRVLQYAGDNILAGFGVDEAKEDDSERAVRCGLDLLALGRTLTTEVEAAHGQKGFDIRVGIHTGGVLLGGGVDADGTIRGMAVNIAARMEQAAPPGGLRISHDTYSQVRGLFEVGAQEALAVKGVDEPVPSYLVVRAKPRNFRIGTRGIEGVATRMIGRDAELEMLQDAFRQLFLQRRLAAVTVVADAGIGKSRLLYEFAAWSEARPETFFIFRGRASPQTQGQPFGLLRDIMAWRLQISDDDSLEVARTKVERGIMPLFERDDGADLAEAHAHLLGHLIGIEWRDSRHIKGILDDPKQIRNRAFHAAAQALRRISVQGGAPIVMQLEDLHWADNDSLDFLAYLCVIDSDVPLLVMAFSRPALFERRADWTGTEASVHRRIDLAPLDKGYSRDLANELLKKLPEVPAALRELVTGGSEGNPFYMEELVKMLIDRRAIDTGAVGTTGETWTVNAERLMVTQVPTTLTGVLQARLDGLPPAEKRMLQEASVIGSVFWDRALTALDAQAHDLLPQLVRRELALPRADASGDDLREYTFKHAILHQVTYATVLKRTKRELHGKLAHWMAAQTGLRANDFLGIAAAHFEEAGDDANAAEFHARAADEALARMAHEAVHKHVKQALALAGLLPETLARGLRWRLLRTRESTLDMQGDRAAQRADIEAMGALADAQGDDALRAHAAWRASVLATRIADWPASQSAAQEAVERAVAAGNVELRLMAQRNLALARARRGDLDRAERQAQAVLAEAGALGLRLLEGNCFNTLAVIANKRDDPVATVALIEQSLLSFRAAGNRQSETTAQSNLGGAWLDLGHLDGARRELEESLRRVKADGDRNGECVPLCHLSALTSWQGDDARALSLARSAVDAAAAVQSRFWEAIAWCRLGEAELSLGRHAAAQQAFEQGRARAIEIEDALRHDAEGGLARVALARGDVGDALRAIAPVLALADGAAPGGALLRDTDFPRLIELTCYRVLAAADDPRAVDWLQRAHSALLANAARISDATLRAGFLENIPQHRAIATHWSEAGAR